MSAHLILMGPSTAGKSTLMQGLAETTFENLKFTIDRTWTTRQRRLLESNSENIFVTPEEFESCKDRFLFRFQTFPTYEYAIETPNPLKENEIRLRILMPVFAQKFRTLVPEPTYFCAISPIHNDPEDIFKERDTTTDKLDIMARRARFSTDQLEAENIADINFQNVEGIEIAVSLLRKTVVSFMNAQSC